MSEERKLTCIGSFDPDRSRNETVFVCAEAEEGRFKISSAGARCAGNLCSRTRKGAVSEAWIRAERA